MYNDRTSNIEQNVQSEHKPKFSYLVKLFIYAFSSTKVISCIYLGVFILLSFMRPLLAFIWERYINTVESLTIADSIFPAALLLIGYFIINFLAELINRYVMPQVYIERLDILQANRQKELMQSRMYKKLASFKPEIFEIAKINDRIEQVFNFVGNEYDGMNTTIMLQSYIVIAKTISVISIAASLYIFNPWLCLIVLFAPLPTLWSLTKGQKLKFKFIKENTKLLRRATYFQNLMLSSACKELKTLGLYDFFYKKWKDIADEYTLKEKTMIRMQSILQIINYLLLSLASAGGIVFAIVLMTMGSITLGALGAAMYLVSTLVQDTKELLTGFATLLTKKNEAAQFFDLMELSEQEGKRTDLDELDVIEAKNLKYRYPLTDRYVVDGINLCIKKGEKVAFVGENGTGKTTFVKLITGTLSPSCGEILINGIKIEDIQSSALSDKLSSVMQNPSHYVTFTINDNVIFGDVNKTVDDASIESAISFAGLDGIKKDSLLGKDVGGTELSGGQWQKLAIARVAYRDRNFIVLDEPTSALDPLAETDIFQKYISLAENKTVIFVTHRISVASLADRIIVFADGKIAQDGTHEELISVDGEYSRLYKEQAKFYNR